MAASRSKKRTNAAPVTVHLLGNAHMDPAWLWPWTEGYTEMIGLTATALKNMEQFPDFTFQRSSASAYEWLLEFDPDMFEQVRERVKEGRWEIVGGWWEQPDLNVPSAESILRQGIYGQRFFLKHFGRTAKIGYNVDAFGHPAALPALLKAVGLEAYVHIRPGRRDIPLIYRWQAPDGSSVIGLHTLIYGTWGKDLCKIMANAIELQVPGVPHVPHQYGIGDHGGGPNVQQLNQFNAIRAGDDQAAIAHGADPEQLARLREVLKKHNVKIIKHNTIAGMLDEIRRTPAFEKKIKTVRGPHHYMAQGSYTSISAIKKGLRKLEMDLFIAESALVAARQLGLDVPPCQDDLDEAWKALLFNQFHDLGAGTCYLPATEDCVRHIEHGRYLGQRVWNRAVQKMYRAVDASKFEYSTFFYNPLPWDVTASVDLRWGPAVYDEAGRPVPFQPVPSISYGCGLERRSTLVTTLPACGGKLFYTSQMLRPSPSVDNGMLKTDGPLSKELLNLFSDVKPEHLDPTMAAQIDQSQLHKPLTNKGRGKLCRMENDFLRVEFDADGRLSRLLHKPSGLNLLKAPIEPLIIDDRGDCWGHDRSAGHPVRYNNVLSAAKGKGAAFVEDGPFRATVATTFKWKTSTIRLEWSLSRHLPYVDATVEINWDQRHRMIKLSLPTRFTSATATVDTPAAPIEVAREGVEETCQKWIHVGGSLAGRQMGLGLANDAKYACSFVGSTMQLTLLRSAHMGAGGPPPPPRAGRYYMDQGLQYFKLRMIPHEGSWQDSQIQRQAMELNFPPVVLHGGMHDGNLLSDFSAVEISPPNVIPFAIKPAYEGGDTIVRLWESSGKATTARVQLGQATGSVRLGKFQFKTLRLTASGNKLSIRETNALELDAGASRASRR